jgi:hypothetical protein
MAPVGKTIRVASIREHGHALKDIRTPSRFSYAAKSIFVFVYVRVYFISLSLSLFVVLRIQRERAGGIFRNTQRHNPKLSKSLFSFLLLRLKKSTRRHADTHTDRETVKSINERSKRNYCALNSRVGFLLLLLGLSSSFKNFLTRFEEKKEEKISFSFV